MFGHRKHARLVWCSTIFWFFQNLQCWYFSNAPLLFLLKELIFVNCIFFQVVILTLKRAFPKMARFLLCTLIIYAGFVFCGWLVLGPFHIKVRLKLRFSQKLATSYRSFCWFQFIKVNALLEAKNF